MWSRDLNAMMANRSSTGSIVDSKTSDETDEGLVQKCVVLQRDEQGYGLYVAGDSPTYVQLVKENGAAARAGIQRGDKIIKVNGTLVTQCSHSEVNDLLRFGSYVNLTLLGRLTPGGQGVTLRNLDDLKERRADSPSSLHNERETDISGPRAVDPAKASQYLLQKITTMKMIQKQIKEELEHMGQEHDRCPSEQLQMRLEAKRQMLGKVNGQLKAMKESDVHPKRPCSAGHEGGGVQMSDDKVVTQFNDATQTTRHKKSDSMPEALYKISGTARHSGHSECKVVAEEGDADGVEKRSKGDAGRVGRLNADSSDARQSPVTGTQSPSLHQLEDPTIFTDLDQLKAHPAHMSVFLHYVMPNFDPSPMLFHIITDSYPHGINKELRKWAYEIYSTFLNEKSPLKVNLNEDIVSTVESILILKHGDDDVMRNIFVPARIHVTDEILDQLADFRAKRASGLGSIYGDHELKDSMDKSTELKIIENGLWKYFERVSSMNKNNDRCKSMASALATFFKGVGLSGSKISSSLERCYTFNAKDKKTFKFKTNKKLINGHQYIAQQYFVPSHCYRCHALFWGIGHQGFRCSHCDINLHKNCIELMREPCSGGTLKKRKEKKVSPSVFEKIISRKVNIGNPTAGKEVQHMHDVLPFSHPTFVAGFSTPSIHTTASTLNGDNEELGRKGRLKGKVHHFYRAFSMPSISDFAPALLFGSKSSFVGLFKSGRDRSKNKRSSSHDHQQQDHHVKMPDDSFEVNSDLLNPAESSTSVSRSESLQGKLDTKINVRRVHSDVTPENQPNQQQLSDSSGCSSNSSLSAKSSEVVHAGQVQEGEAYCPASRTVSPVALAAQSLPPHTLQQQHSFSNFPIHSQHLQQPHSFISHSLSSLIVQPQQLQQQQRHLGFASDSDFEVDPELPSIESYISKEQLRKLKPKERKRQEVINELFHTEQAHVRNLKVMHRIFYLPMLDEASVPKDLINLIFPNLQELIDCHCALNEDFKVKRREENVVGDFARILERKFSGIDGEKLKNLAATFCENQSHCLEVLKLRLKKDGKFAAFLQEAASNPLCRRLELKDLIPTEMQRLTKYPLLIENLLKYTQTNTEEYEILLQALDHSKSVLSFVDQKVKECENLQKLSDLQRRLDTKPIENSTHPILSEYKRLDLRRHKMIYDGPMTWRICRSKQLEMHAVLMEDIIVLLQKTQDSEKLVLRCQSSNVGVALSPNPLVGGGGGGGGGSGTSGNKDDSKLTHSPIVKLNNILLRNVATDKKAFFLVSISEFGPQIYEFVAPTKDEKNRWFKYISDAADAHKYRKGVVDKNPQTPGIMAVNYGGYMSGSNVVTTGGQEVETVQPTGSIPLLSSISSIIPDDIGQLHVAKIDPSFHRHQSQIETGRCPLQEVKSRSRSRSCDSDSDGQDGASDDNSATVMLVESDGADDSCLVQPEEVKVSTFQILEKRLSVAKNTADEVHDINAELLHAMMEKKRVVAELLEIPLEEYDNFAQIAEEEAGHSSDVRELLLAMLAQTDHLVELINSRADCASAFAAQKKMTKAATADLNKMVIIPSSQILGISSKLNQLLLQLMEILVQQDKVLDDTDALNSDEPPRNSDPRDRQTTGSERREIPDRALLTSGSFDIGSIPPTENVTALEATVFECPEFETGQVLATSVDSLYCGAVPFEESSSPLCSGTTPPSSSSSSLTSSRTTQNNDDSSLPSTTSYTSSMQFPRQSTNRQPLSLSTEASDDLKRDGASLVEGESLTIL